MVNLTIHGRRNRAYSGDEGGRSGGLPQPHAALPKGRRRRATAAVMNKSYLMLQTVHPSEEIVNET